MNLTCDLDPAPDLRAAYRGITPGCHTKKEHGNTVDCGSDVPGGKIERLIHHSYERGVATLPTSRRQAGYR